MNQNPLNPKIRGQFSSKSEEEKGRSKKKNLIDIYTVLRKLIPREVLESKETPETEDALYPEYRLTKDEREFLKTFTKDIAVWSGQLTRKVKKEMKLKEDDNLESYFKFCPKCGIDAAKLVKLSFLLKKLIKLRNIKI